MDDTSGRPIAARLGFLVYRLHLALREAFEERLSGQGITPGDWGVLAHIWEGVGTPAALADFLGVHRTAITRTLDRLEAAGLVARGPNAEDGRSFLLALTADGERAACRAASASDRVNAEFTAGLTDAERVQLMDLLRKTIRTMPGRRRAQEECPDG